jgi:hypothetical protein
MQDVYYTKCIFRFERGHRIPRPINKLEQFFLYFKRGKTKTPDRIKI